MRSFEHPTDAPRRAGRGDRRGIARLAALALLALAAACGGKDDTVIPGRQDLAQASRGIVPGRTYDNREKIRAGMKESELSAACGEPSEKLESRGDVVSGHWTYLYKDGKLTIHLRDHRVTDVETTFY
jgi:hypothetical protein